MILVTGANGHLGSQTIDFLLQNDSSSEVAGLVRSEKKGAELREKGVELRIGNYNNKTSITKALRGIDTLLLISSSTVEGRVKQHKNVIDAAKETGVQHIFYTSIVLADKQLSPLSESHNETEKLIYNSEIPFTIYRNTFYGEFLPMYLGDALETGDWYFPSDGEKINLALRSEMAEALANGLADSPEHQNKVYEITSRKAYSLKEIADLLSSETGKDITYHDLPVADFKKNLQEAGLPDEAVMLSVSVATTFVNGGLNHTEDALSKLLGREAADIEAFLPDVLEG